MKLKFEHQSLIIGIATGFFVAMLVFCIIWLNIKNSELLELEWTHFVYLEQPKIIQDKIETFLEK